MKNVVNGLKPLFESKLISVEDALRELEALPDAVPNTQEDESNINQVPQIHSNLDYAYVPRSAFSTELIQHYKHPLINLDLNNGLYVSRRKIRRTLEIIEVGKKLGLNLENKIDSCGFLGQINWNDSKLLVEEGLGARMLTPILYFHVLKWAETNDSYFAEDLKNHSEWLDAITKEGAKDQKAKYIIYPDKFLNNGFNYGRIVQPQDKYFDYENIDVLSGLPGTLKDSGKFKQWYSDKFLSVVVRSRDVSVLQLNLNIGPHIKDNRLGVRVAKL